jgi:anti-sigma regulatory factor (Ser/Thr protein kinase)
MHTPAPAPSLRAIATAYPGKPESIRQVRADLRRVLNGCPVADDVILCASELSANAAQHSDSREPGGTFTVRAQIHPGDHVQIEVEDNGGPWVEPSPDPSRGRGLDIVRALAADSGVTSADAGRRVWACIVWPSA